VSAAVSEIPPPPITDPCDRSEVTTPDALPSPWLEPPFSEQFKGSALARWLLNRWGWRVLFFGFPTRQGVIIVYPHTSNWDFIVMILAKWSVGVQVRFWGKDSLFQIPGLGAWLRWLGGVPVNRKAAKGLVGDTLAQMAQAERRNELFWLGLAPEGTRKKMDGLRGGFYQVALGAQVPVGVIALDYQSRVVGIHQFFMLTGDSERDYRVIAAGLRDAVGRYPSMASPIRPLDSSVSRSEATVL
jgi:1-acyl-sn-glycerol-3-phosphate acyltransferase